MNPLPLLYSLLLRLLPRDFRVANGGAMRETAFERIREARRRSRWAAIAMAGRELGDLAVVAWRLRSGDGSWPVRPSSRDMGAVWGRFGKGERGIRMGDFVRSLKLIVRSLARRPGYTAIAVLTLAGGIGINSAMFTVVRGVLVRPFPFEDDENLVFVFESPVDENEWHTVAPANYLEWRRRTRTLDDLAAFNLGRAVLTGGGPPEQVQSSVVSAHFFDVLGVELMLGSGFRPEHEERGGPPAVILSHGLWTRMFGAEPSVVGRTLEVDGEPSEIVGVLPASYRHPDPTEHRRLTALYLPLRIGPDDFGRFIRTVGRIGPGATIQSVDEEVRQIAADLRREFPEANENTDVLVVGIRDFLVGDRRSELLLLSGAVGVLLAIVSVNLAGLVLVQSRARRAELALKQALGAGSRRIMGQIVAEVAVLAGVGTILGLAMASASLGAIEGLVTRHVSGLAGLELDAGVVGFTAVSGAFALSVVGVLPALQALRLDLRGILVEGGGRGGGPRRTGLRDILVTVEVALTVALVASAGLLGRSFDRLVSQSTGFDPEGVMTFDLRPQSSRHPQGSDIAAFYSAVHERVTAIPGVTAVGWTQDLPFSSTNWGTTVFPTDGAAADTEVGVEYKMVNADYFRALDLEMREGRTFGVQDGPEDPTTVVLNETLAALLWPGEVALGRVLPTQLRRGGGPQTQNVAATVVGVVEDLRDNDFESAPDPIMYVHHVQFPQRTMTAVVRVVGDPEDYVPLLRREVSGVDDLVALGDPVQLSDVVADAVAAPRMLSLIVSFFGLAALGLAGFGVYGVVANGVSQRVHEFGIRMAIGARASSVRDLVLRDSLRLGVVGAVLGIGASLLVGRLLAGVLFQVSPWDPLTLVASFVAVLLAVLLAAYLPARQAAKLDPVEAIGRS